MRPIILPSPYPSDRTAADAPAAPADQRLRDACRGENGVRLLRPLAPILSLDPRLSEGPRRRRLVLGSRTVAVGGRKVLAEPRALLLFLDAFADGRCRSAAAPAGRGGGGEAVGAGRGREGGADRGGAGGAAGHPCGAGGEGVEAPGGGHALRRGGGRRRGGAPHHLQRPCQLHPN